MVALRSRPVIAALGSGLALAAALVAPSSQLLPGPHSAFATLVSAIVLGTAFVAGLRWPVEGFFALIVLTVMEGAIRKWIVNDVTVFLLKDFLLLGIYAAVIARLRRAQLMRPLSVLLPIAGIVVLAVVLSPRSVGVREVVIGLRSYVIYLPLIWVAPAVLGTRRRVVGLLVLLASFASGESILAVVQAFSGPGGVNKLVSGAKLGYITLGGRAYIRPAGTFMQVGVLAAFLFFGLLAAFMLVVMHRRGRSLLLGVAAAAVLPGGIVYTSARTLFGSALIAGAMLLVTLLVRRRVLTLAAVGASVVAGFAFSVYAVPRIVDALEGHAGGVGGGASIGSGYLGRASDFNTASGRVPLYGSRIKPQLELMRRQGVVGHGPGTMTLGSEYANPSQVFQGEGTYSKFAWELGLPGLALFLWLVVALAVATIRGARRADDLGRPLAMVGVASALVLPIWFLFEFALDLPIIAMLFWSFTGCALVYAPVSTRLRSRVSNRAAIRGQASSAS